MNHGTSHWILHHQWCRNYILHHQVGGKFPQKKLKKEMIVNAISKFRVKIYFLRAVYLFLKCGRREEQEHTFVYSWIYQNSRHSTMDFGLNPPTSTQTIFSVFFDKLPMYQYLNSKLCPLIM